MKAETGTNTLKAVMLEAGDAVRHSIRVSVVARVTAYDPTGPTVDAVPVVREVRRVDGVWVAVPAKELRGIPVQWPGGGLRGFTAGLSADDMVTLLIRTQSHDEVDTGAAPTGPDQAHTPAAKWRLNLTDALALPGFFAPGDGPPADSYHSSGAPVIYYPEDEQLRAGDSAAAKALALAEKVDARLADIKSAHNSLADFVNNLTLVVSTGGTAGPIGAGAPTVGTLDPTDCDDILVRS